MRDPDPRQDRALQCVRRSRRSMRRPMASPQTALGASDLVGRGAELSLLGRRVTEAADGRGGMVLLAGEPGHRQELPCRRGRPAGPKPWFPRRLGTLPGDRRGAPVLALDPDPARRPRRIGDRGSGRPAAAAGLSAAGGSGRGQVSAVRRRHDVAP